MIETILSTLAELGLLREDYKHREHISKIEKADGEKRPFQKYFFQPSTLLIIAVPVVIIVTFLLFFNPRTSSIYKERTQKEISEMTDRMNHWNERLGYYPADLNELIGNDPIKQDWAKDAWKKPYKFEITTNGKGFSIISAGADGKFGTSDDIKSK